MLVIRPGEKGPRVVLLQILLNRRGAGLAVDGDYGPKTAKAVSAFRKHSQLGERQDVDTMTFRGLIEGGSSRVVDVVDCGDEGVAVTAPMAKARGSEVVEIGAMCNGIQVMVSEVQARSSGGSIALLRIHGHGNLGRWMTVSAGAAVHAGPDGKPREVDGYAEIEKEPGSYISDSNFDSVSRTLSPLRALFAPYGSLEHMGCSLGSRPETRHLMSRLASLLGVPVSAGRTIQQHAFCFDGPVEHAYPGGASLGGWSKKFRSTSY